MENNDKPLEHKMPPEDDRKKVESINKYLFSAANYKMTRGYHEKWAEYLKFWESNQWPETVEGTENFPRPVTNHYAEIIEMKTAGLAYDKPEMYFETKKGALSKMEEVKVTPLDPEEEPFTIKPEELLVTMIEHIGDYNNIDFLLEEMARSAALLCNGLLYTYWDNTVMASGEGGSIGEIAVMEIDIADFYPGNPKESDLQKQPYIMVTERRPLRQVREEYREFSEYADMLKAETSSRERKVYEHEKYEPEKAEYVDLIHYWEKKLVTKDTEVEGETVKTRHYQVDYCVVCQDYILREKENCAPYTNRYPFANFPWIPGRKSFYAKSESDDLINNQKELNRLQGIAILGAYKTGLPNIRYKENFVKKEDLQVGPGGHIIPDSSPPGTGWAVDYLQPPSIAAYIPLLKDTMAQGMKDTSGVHEAWSGKAPSAHLNASAILALQEAAGVRIRPIQRRMFNAYKELGIIWLGLMKENYTEDRMYKVFGKKNIEGLAWFKLDEIDPLDFDVKVTTGDSSPYSKSVIAATLENLAEKGMIDAEMYLNALPPEVFPKVTVLLEMMKDRVTEQEQKIMEQQLRIIDEIVAKTIEEARAQQIEITPEALVSMREMIAAASPEEEI